VLGYFRVDQLAPDRLEARQGAGLILAHHPAVAGDVGREDRRQPALDSLSSHVALLRAHRLCSDIGGGSTAGWRGYPLLRPRLYLYR
jgi:hypothetical protein